MLPFGEADLTYSSCLDEQPHPPAATAILTIWGAGIDLDPHGFTITEAHIDKRAGEIHVKAHAELYSMHRFHFDTDSTRMEASVWNDFDGPVVLDFDLRAVVERSRTRFAPGEPPVATMIDENGNVVEVPIKRLGPVP